MKSGKDRVVLEARQITKSYPATLALDHVDFRIRAGKVTALIGENGAGKSTLVKILGGIEQPTEGSLLLDGTEIHMLSVRDADARGIGIIHQELNLCPNLSVAENIFLAHEITSWGGVLNRRLQLDRTRDLLCTLEHPIDPAALVGDLALGQRQIVEIAKALAREVRVLMMDEPTSALSATEIAVLFRVIRDLASCGVSIVYISHRLEELLQICDSVSVLRDGRMVAEAAAKEVDTKWIVEQMTGRPSGLTTPATHVEEGSEILRAQSLSLTAESGRPILRNVSFCLRAGEILGIYGLMGAGRTELMESLMGLHAEVAGSIWLDSKPVHSLQTPERIAAGLAMVPEDRQVSGLVQTLSVRANMTLASLRKFARGFFLSSRKEELAAKDMVKDLKIKTPGLSHPISSLSGGNQQKVVIAKCLLTCPRVLLLDEPARGVDVAAKSDIYGIVRKLAASGLGIVLVSSELEEVRSVADRILVMSRGVITGEFSSGTSTGEALAAAASFGLQE